MATSKTETRMMRLGDITSKIGSGATPRGGKNDYKTEGISLIRSLNIYDFDFSEQDLALIDDKQAAALDNVEVQEDDILLNITGASVARCCLVNPKFLPARVNQHVAIVRVRSDIADARFVLYCINSRQYKSRLLSLAQGGATREALTKKTIEDFTIPHPPRSIQHKIAGILSAYDDLIENNLRRIKILEEMARSLYREWFVNFRFPGHQKVRMVNSPLGKIPEGWEVTAVGSVFQILGGGTPAKTVPEYWEGGEIEWFTPSDLTKAATMFLDQSGNRITELGLSKSSAHTFPAFSVMLTSRATIGVVAINTSEASTNQGFITCIPNQKFPLYVLYHWLRENTDVFISHASGATFKEISKGVFKTLPLLLPPVKLTKLFNGTVEPMGLEILNLIRRSSNLRQTRDLLLPKLISGDLDVSKLDIRLREKSA